MARRRYRFLKITLPLLTLVGAVLVVGYLQATRPEIERTGPAERARPIAASTVQIADIQPAIDAFGEVVAQRDVELRALVAGPVVAVGENFENGGTVRAGELLVAIDPFEYRAAVTEAEAALAEARAQLAETRAEVGAEEAGLVEDRTQLALAERELDRREALLAKGTASEKDGRRCAGAAERPGAGAGGDGTPAGGPARAHCAAGGGNCSDRGGAGTGRARPREHAAGCALRRLSHGRYGSAWQASRG